MIPPSILFSGMMTAPRSRILAAVSSMVILVWLVIVTVLARRFNVPSGDGLIYSLPFSTARHPFDLGIPHLGNFRQYGEAWGHHWPGSMWLRGLLFYLISYSRVADVAVLSLFQAAAAWICARLVWRATGNFLFAALVLVVVLSDRLLLLACAGNRFEAIPVAVVAVLFANACTGISRRNGWWKQLVRAAAFLCPTLHPYALVMGLMVILYECARGIRCVPREREPFVRLAFFAAGFAATALWLAVVPIHREQFLTNLALQNSFYQSWNSVASGLGNYRMGSGVWLWMGGLLSAALLACGVGRLQNLAPEWRFLAPALFLSVIAMHTLTRCENFHYLTFGSPLAAVLVAVALHTLFFRKSAVSRLFACAAMSAMVAPHALVIPYRMFQFYQAGRPDLQAGLSSVLRELPAEATVFGCYLFWPVAGERPPASFRFSTFPIASRKAWREHYEQQLASSAKLGDFLIIDNSSYGQPDRFGLHPTFPQNPPDPTCWKWKRDHKQLFPGAVAWGIDLSIYEFNHP